MRKKLVTVYTELILPIIFIFCFFLLLFIAVIFVDTQILNPQRPPIPPAAVNFAIFFSATLVLIFSLPLIIIWVIVKLLMRSPILGKKLAKRTSLETAYTLKSIFTSTSVPVLMVAATFVVLMYSAEELKDLYFLAGVAFVIVFAILMSISEGILGEREEASLLLRRFSEDIKASMEKRKTSRPSSIRLAKALKTFDKTLPSACHIPSRTRRQSQVELILSLGDKKDLSALSKHVLAVALSMERDYLKGFQETYENLTEFLDDFEYEKSSVAELGEKVSLRDRMKKFSGEVLREILAKTIPYLIAIAISILLYMWLSIPFKLPT